MYDVKKNVSLRVNFCFLILISAGHVRYTLYSLWRNSPTRARASSFLRFLDHTKWHTTVGRTPLDEGSAIRRDLYLTTHNTDKRQTSMSPAGFEPTIPASERPQKILHVSSTGIGTGKNAFTSIWCTEARGMWRLNIRAKHRGRNSRVIRRN